MIETMLTYYGYETFEEFENTVGLFGSDAERLLTEMYEEDTAPMAY